MVRYVPVPLLVNVFVECVPVTPMLEAIQDIIILEIIVSATTFSVIKMTKEDFAVVSRQYSSQYHIVSPLCIIQCIFCIRADIIAHFYVSIVP